MPTVPPAPVSVNVVVLTVLLVAQVNAGAKPETVNGVGSPVVTVVDLLQPANPEYTVIVCGPALTPENTYPLGPPATGGLVPI